MHGEALRSTLKPNIIVFGEWCAARHTLDYETLPDWFLLFDVYDRRTSHFWSSSRRNALARSARLATVPQIVCGRYTVDSLKELVFTRSSHYRKGPLEGVVIRRSAEFSDKDFSKSVMKCVRANHVQTTDHWKDQEIVRNKLND